MRDSGTAVTERLHVAVDSPVHRLPAHVKIVVAVASVFVIVLTAQRVPLAYAAYLIVVLGLVHAAGLRFGQVLPRMVVEVPFLAFVVLLPFIGTGPDVQVGPFSLSEPGLWEAVDLAGKATLGVLIAIVLAATTRPADAIDGLHRLRLPDLLVQILSSMVRYLEVVFGESARMARAREARGFTARGPKSWSVLAAAGGTLFIRSYERGERVHRAMLARGYTGRLPGVGEPVAATGSDWLTGSALPLLLAFILAGTHLLGPT